MHRLALGIGVALQQLVRTQRLLTRPLRQTLGILLVQLARRTATRFVAQSGYALLTPAPPGLDHRVNVQILHLSHLAAQQRLAQ